MLKQGRTLHCLDARAICLAATLWLLWGCKSASDSSPPGSAPPAPGVVAQPANPFLATIERAAPYYAKGYNQLVHVVDKLAGQYQNAVKDGPGEQKRKPIMLNVFMTDEKAVEEAAAIFAEGKRAAPAGDTQLSLPAENALASARAVIKNYQDAYAYYSAEKYKDDRGAAGVAIHSQMEVAVQGWKTWIQALDQQLTAIEQKQMIADLQHHGDQTTYGHHFRAFNLVATAFMKVDESAAAVDKASGELEAAYNKIKAFANTKGPDMPQAFAGYMIQVDNLYAQAAVVQRSLREKVDATKLTNDFDLLVSRYNSLIQVTNSLYSLEEQNLL